MYRAFFVGVITLASALHAQAPGSADLIITNARIYTIDPNRPVASAMAVRNGRVLFTGPEKLALALRGANTEVLDARGMSIIPGMIDAHVHLTGLGQALQTVDLRGTTSFEEVIDRVATRARNAAPGTWIFGHGWDQNDWGDTRFPTHERLSAAIPNNPVVLQRVDGHAMLVNAAAMRAAGLGASSRSPSGGSIIRAANGLPTGVLVDNAMALVAGTVPKPTPDELRQQTLAAVVELNRWGLTSVHDAGVDRAVIDVFEEVAREGRLSIRNYVMVSGDDETIAHYLTRGPQSGLHGGTLWIRAIKLVADGALGSRGASLLEPYSDDEKSVGLPTIPSGRVQQVVERALKRGFQVNTHAIGDRANRLVLDEIERGLTAVPVADHRFRIEHAQIIHPDDIGRFARLGIIPSMQSSHQTSDMYWAGRRLGQDRLRGAYAWRDLLNTGVVIANGSDLPVERSNPLISFHAAVARQDDANWPAGGWFPEQRMTREEALKSMTIWAAYAAFMDKDVGSLEPGKFADFVVLDQDIMRVPAELILHTRVMSTWLGGKKVFER